MDAWNPDNVECQSKSACGSQLKTRANVPIDAANFGHEPNLNSVGNKDCLEFHDDGEIKDENCGDTKKALCEVDCGGEMHRNSRFRTCLRIEPLI